MLVLHQHDLKENTLPNKLRRHFEQLCMKTIR